MKVNMNYVNRNEVNMVRLAPSSLTHGTPIDPDEYFVLDISMLNFARLK